MARSIASVIVCSSGRQDRAFLGGREERGLVGVCRACGEGWQHGGKIVSPVAAVFELGEGARQVLGVDGAVGAGDGGRNAITGGAANDTLSGGAGNDRVDGASGDDRFVFVGNSGKDLVRNVQAGPGSNGVPVFDSSL